MIWAARKLAKGPEPDKARAAYQEAGDFARNNGLAEEAGIALGAQLELEGKPGEAGTALDQALGESDLQLRGMAWFFRGSAHDEQKEYDAAIECYKRALGEPRFDRPGAAWYNMGNALVEKGDYDAAIKSYQKVLEDPRFDTPGDAWYNMGNALTEKGDYDAAIKCYQKALEDPRFDTPGNAWNNMGNALRHKGDYDAAIDTFKKALEDPRYETPAYAWNNMGNALGDKGDYVAAIESYKKALEDPRYDRPGDAWHNMALTLARKGDSAEALSCLQKAEKAYREHGDDERARQEQALAAAARLAPGRRSSKDEAAMRSAALPALEDGYGASPEQRMKQKLLSQEADAYEEYAREERSSLKEVFAILKGWGSAVPLLAGGQAACRGGGYFLKWRGTGLVVDPGFDFLKNFHDAGFHADEIQGVLVSHDHTDHNHDLRTLDDIKYELYKRMPDKRKRAYDVFRDTGTAHSVAFDPPEAAHRQPLTELELSLWKKKAVKPLPIGGNGQAPFTVRYFAAHHGLKDALGLRVECLDAGSNEAVLAVGFSCDTGYFEDLCSPEYLGKCDILVAHISEPDAEEYEDPEHLKKNHLGYRGAARLIQGCKPRLTVVCEFWAGVTDLRLDLVQGLRNLCNTKAILPGGVGLFIKPSTLDVRCSSCQAWCPRHEISVSGSDIPFGPLRYLCPNCRL
jgi:tetratricopeptide (TPR) repeat protein